MVAYKKNPTLCIVPYCRNLRAKSNGGRKCYRHQSQLWRLRQPFRAAFHTLKMHAKQRRIEFTITFGEFLHFAKKSEYVREKGNTATGATVDRKDNLKGYVPGNIQKLTRSANTEKQNRQDAVRMQAGTAWQRNGS